jgi:hypothetical protein
MIPVGTEIIVFYQRLYFVGFKPPPRILRAARLFVAPPVFVFSGRQIFLGDKIVTVTVGRQYQYIFHKPPAYVITN